MGLFKKKGGKSVKKEISSLPQLPKLPNLPELRGQFEQDSRSIHQLPSFPNDSLGEKFSQNTIKEAITGKKEGDKEIFDADEFESDDEKYEERMMPESPRKNLTREFKPQSIPTEFKTAARKVKEAEPIFIRIDKFEESLEIFEKTKKQIHEIEKMLSDIKKIREKEEEELDFWEGEIKTAKEKIERVDENLFSKIE